jgi:hypothetical protein
MFDILESLRRTIYRWVNTTVALTQDASFGDSTIKVVSSARFRVGDEVALHNGVDGEPGFTITEIPDVNTIVLSKPIEVITGWKIANNAMITKTYNGQFVQAIYLGDPDVIPKYPAITIMGENRESEWFTLETTKETYNAQIVVYAESANDEDSYRTVSTIANIIQQGLKKNIFPLVGPYDVTRPLADIENGDEFIKVADSSVFTPGDKILLENTYQAQELRVACVVDSTTIQVWPNPHIEFLVSDQTKIIKLNRFIYNSWPSSVSYGYRYKGSLLHAASIKWFGNEQEIQTRHGWSDPQLS